MQRNGTSDGRRSRDPPLTAPARDQVADLYPPAGDGPFPVVVVVHGGFWRARFGLELMHDVCRDLQMRGLAAWNVEYRRLGTGGGWPVSLEDVQLAIAALGRPSTKAASISATSW